MLKNFERNAIAALLALLVPVMLAAAAARHCAPQYHPTLLQCAAACLAWLSSLGIAHAAAVNAHIRIPILAHAAGPDARRRLRFFADSVFLIFCLASLVIGVLVLRRSLVDPTVSGHPLIYASIPVGSALAVVRLVQRLAGGEETP